MEPNASDRVEENLTTVGRAYYSGSTFLCLPNSLSQAGGYSLGAQAGEAAIRRIRDLGPGWVRLHLFGTKVFLDREVELAGEAARLEVADRVGHLGEGVSTSASGGQASGSGVAASEWAIRVSSRHSSATNSDEPPKAYQNGAATP